MLSGVVGIDGGIAIVNDTLKLSNIKPYDIYNYGITRTFQEARLFNQMTVLDNMLVVLTERNVFGALLRDTMIIIWAKRETRWRKLISGKKKRIGGQSFLRPKKTVGDHPRHFHAGGNLSL